MVIPPQTGRVETPTAVPQTTNAKVNSMKFGVLIVSIAVVMFIEITASDAVNATDADRPNIVFILADDLGWADTTLYGHTSYYKTPNIERLAKRGMTFTHAYAASPLCSPTRSSILTGLSPARTGITTPNCHLPEVVLQATAGTKAPGNQKSIGPTPVTRLNTTYSTLGEALHDAGYATGHFGKWHLGSEPYSPLQQGFDVDVPHWSGPGPAGSYVAPWKFKDFAADPREPDQHIEDRMAREATAFMEQHKDQPFFLNYWMFSVHAPFDAKKSLVERYRSTTVAENPQRSPTYAAMVESMDDAVGTLLDTLDRLGIAENTMIIFFSDNGGNMYSEIDDTVPTSNAPLRGGKATVYEGGIRVPCVISWPGVIDVETRSDAVVQSCDFYPTILDALKLKPKPDQHFDGISILPALRGQPLLRDAIFTYFPHDPPVPDWVPPSVVVHQNEWKLIRIFYGGENGAHRWKLFNLSNDIGEKDDLAAKEPDRVKVMDLLIERFLADTTAVQPVRNPAFDPATFNPDNEGKPKPRSKQKSNDNVKPNPKTVTNSADDPRLLGWKLRGCAGTVNEGVLTVTANGNTPFLGFAAGKLSGPTVAKFRIRSSASGEAKVEWLPSPQANNKAQSVAYRIVEGDWQDISVTLPAEGTLGIVRFYLPTQKVPVQIDSIELQSTDSKLLSNF